MKARHAEIAGAGLGGLAVAIALRERGWSVRIHERSSELRDAGAGIYLSGNGIRVLKALGVHEEVGAGALRPQEVVVRVGNAERSRHAINTGEDPVWTMTRQHLYGCVLERARSVGVTIEAGSGVAGATPEGVLLLADGSHLQADLVIGADGVRSSVRASLPFQVERQQFDDGIVRVLASSHGISASPSNEIVDHFSPDASLPLRALNTPVAPGVVYLALMADAHAERAVQVPPDPELWGARFPELTPLLRKLTGTARFDRYQATIVDRWSCGRVALVGDAAHAMPPTLGQGAGFAMMNGLALATYLLGNDDVETALATWEREERAFTDRTQRKAIEVAMLRQRRADLDPLEPVGESARHIPTGTHEVKTCT